MSVVRPLALATATALLAACATVPQPLQGTYSAVTTQAAQQGGAGGTRVRWGGEIIKTEPREQETCFYILSRPLDGAARPELERSDDASRFVACRSGFYDPEVFTRGRDITVTGTLHGVVSQKVGDYDYAYPRVEADVVYLWPKRPQLVNYTYGPNFYNPWWGPWGPWNWGPSPYWGSRVIIHQAPPPQPPPRPSMRTPAPPPPARH